VTTFQLTWPTKRNGSPRSNVQGVTFDATGLGLASLDLGHGLPGTTPRPTPQLTKLSNGQHHASAPKRPRSVSNLSVVQVASGLQQEA